jgi:hypothetical protein
MHSSPAARPRRAVLTVLDVIIIVAAAIGIVAALDAAGRVSAGPFFLSIRDPFRPLMLAAIAALIRLRISHAHLLPALHIESIGPKLNAERERLAHPPPATREVKYYAMAAALASLVWLTPHLANIRHVPDAGDPVFSAWRLARFAHQLANEPTRLFDGNIFHPAPYTLTYSDATVLEGLAAFPFIAAGADPLVVSNALFLASFPLCALAFFYAGWRLTGDAQSACVAGILGGLSAFKIEHYSHLELQFFCFAPLSIVMLLRMLAAPGWRTGALLGVTVMAQWLACMYLGVMLFAFLAAVAVVAAVAWRVRPTRAFTVAVATAALIMIAGASITVIPYMRSQSHRGERALDVVRSYSAEPRDYAAPTRRLASYEHHISRGGNQPERELFPGVTPLVLATVGIVPPMSVAALALVSGTAVSFDGSLGLNGLIYDELYAYVLPFRGMRVPARFAALAGTGLVLLSAFGAKRVLRLGRTPRRRAAIFAVLAAGALIDLRSRVELEPYFDTIPPIYAAVTPEMVLAELPMEVGPNFTYMYFSTFHWARLINGQSGYAPASYAELERDMEAFPEGDLLDRLRRQGATHVTVNCRLFSKPWRCPPLLETLDGVPELQLISAGQWEGADVRLYALRR